MTMALSEGKGTTPYGLQVQNVYTDLRDSSNRVSVVIKNTTGKAVMLNKGVAFAKVVATNEIPAFHLKSSMMEALDKMQGIERPRMSVFKWRKKLIQKLDLSGLKGWPNGQAKAARELLIEYHNVFALEGNELGCTSTIEHVIILTDLDLYKERFHKIPPPMLDKVWNTLKDMLDSGAIRPSQSPWCNAVVLVRKKDRGLHFCIHFQKLNSHTKKDSFLLPQIQEALESLVGTGHFSCIDLKLGFWQIQISPESKQCMAFTIHNLWFYECEWMPFRLCNAPATFQQFMQNCLGELNLTCCIIYLDDIIVYSKMES